MRDRADEIGGSVQIRSEPGAGTCVIIDVPLSPNRVHSVREAL
jgi:signal transduction histidine kinase